MAFTRLQDSSITAWSEPVSVATGFDPWVYWGLTLSSSTSGVPMLKIQRKTNPFGRAETSNVPFEGKTLREILAPHTPGKDFHYPTFVRVNKVPRLRKDWDNVVADESEVEIIAVVGEVVTALVIINLVLLTASAAFTVYGIHKAKKAMRALRAGRGQDEGDPFFSVDGHANKANLNNPVEVAYGRNRMWPSYIGRPYRTYMDDRMAGWDNTSYIKNTNFVQIFCLGQGDFEVHSVQVGDVLLESYRGMRYELVRPGESSVTLSRIMYVQPDFEEITLAVDQSTDMFSMSPPGQTAYHFEVDVEFPTNGEYTIEALPFEIDPGTGAVIATVAGIDLTRPLNHAGGGTLESNSPPHRHTFTFTLGTSGKRYGFRFHNKATSKSVKILELRSYNNPTIPIGYSDKTLLIVNYFVTNLSEDIVKDKINVIATRKLKTIQVAGTERTEIVQPTRSIPWAIYDALTNNVYGGGLSEEFIDLENFAEMHGELEPLEIYFDYVFNQSTTVSDAVKVIAAAGRCSLAYNGSRLTLVRDNGNSIPEAMFSAENIIPGSLSWATEMFDPTDPDAVETSYVDIDSGEQRTTVFTPEGSLSNNVQKITLQGVAGLQRSWREAAFRMRKTQLVRDTFKFKTGMEGYIPSIGATALLSAELEGMGTAGYVESYASGWAQLSRPVTVATSGPLGRIAFRRDDGSVMGPYTVLSTAQETEPGKFKAVSIGAIAFSMDFWRNDKEPVHFIFNSGDTTVPIATKIQIENVAPSDDGTIEMTVTNFDPRVYEFDGVQAPADEYLPVNPVGAVPSVPWVRVDSVEHPVTDAGLPYTRIRWGSAFSATYYRVYVAGVLRWSGTDTYLELPLVAGDDVLIEVAGVNGASEGPVYPCRATIGGDVFLANPYVRSVTLEEDGVEIVWDDVIGADFYEVQALTVAIATNIVMHSVQAKSFKYTKAMFKHEFGDVLVTTSTYLLGFNVRARVNGFWTNITYVTTSVPIAPSPTGIVIEQDPQVIVGNIYTRHRTIKWAAGSGALAGTTYNLYMEVYNNGVGSATLSVRPWTRITTTDKFIFSSDLPIPYVQDVDLTVTPQANYTHPIYGDGCYAYITNGVGNPNFILDPGDKLDYGLFIFDAAEYAANPACFTGGKFHPILKAGASQIDGYVWIANADMTYLTGKRASMVYAHRDKDQLGSDWRVKGAIVADNGWFVPTPPNSTTTFDIDA